MFTAETAHAAAASARKRDKYARVNSSAVQDRSQTVAHNSGRIASRRNQNLLTGFASQGRGGWP